MAIYALAFIAFAADLAKRSADVTAAAELTEGDSASAPVAATVGSAGNAMAAASADKSAYSGRRPVGTLTRTDPDAPQVQAKKSAVLRVAVALTVLGLLLHLTAAVTRGVAAERVPWANMYEFAMTGTLLIIATYLVVLTRVDLRFLGTFIVGLVLVMLGLAAVNFYVEVVPLPPALQSAWLVIHVFVASTGTALFALGFALSVLQLVQHRRETSGSDLKSLKLKFVATLPSAARLENLAYRSNIVAFILWTFTLIAGAIWAERAWGRYWGWDTKEVWTFIIWVIYAGYIHARATRGWRGSRSAWLSIIGFVAVIFNFSIVNLFFKGLHAYSGL
ncbi:c-type cytochrome biogenesis protein CcsB [Mycetocola zhujimingii]|uniref:C-type cytochrome biogenesis protein CcsB n=1 Tax=Mycetocola zhujimingii TaxID=2079792 RepID=A0A2U1TB17_9MICO|nr:c-type cytochrome biogenesis protein CcsB [Mycetocola zhujimingii]PWC04770.1 c-type cytochrome biogenesis protein CcsB [Mycetocola zhujimingii]